MRPLVRTLYVSAFFLVVFAGPFALAQVDPSGHWEGTLQIPEMEMKIEVDLAKSAGGELSGTYGNPAGGLRGYPLRTVTVEGQSVRFTIQIEAKIATFDGTLSADGKSLAGTASRSDGSAPFRLTRTGDARIAPPPKNAPIGKEMEGTWTGTLDAGKKQLRLILKMANQPDGTSAGSVVSPDGSTVELPIAMTQEGSRLSIQIPVVGASWSGDLSADRTALAGTWSQGGMALPLTFHRASAGE